MFIQQIVLKLSKDLRKMKCLVSPVGVRGMTELDRDKFRTEVDVPVLKVREDKINNIIPIIKKYLLKLENFKPIQYTEPENGNKHIYLNPDILSKWNDFSKNDLNILENSGTKSNDFINKKLVLSYNNFRVDQIFNFVLPEGEEVVSGYSQIGHIIHLNLRDHLLPYKKLIGQVLLDKIKICKTVVTKSNIIDNTYRNFAMELLAGEENYIVTVKENRCNFQFDFTKVYWNPRLGKEHERILSYINPGDVLFDIFCGVGPFSIPAAKKKCRVFANDLNPEAFMWLNSNAKANKVDSRLFKAFNQDGGEFIETIFKEFLEKCCKDQEKLDESTCIHVTMNLPAMAVTFLSKFKGLIKGKELDYKLNYKIILYVYCFVFGKDEATLKNEAKLLLNNHMDCDMSNCITDIFNVRNVSPNKEMMRITLLLNDYILFANKGEEEPPRKKTCIENSVAMDCSCQELDGLDADFTSVLRESRQVLQECFKTYALNEVFLSFNGGKDCTVMLDIVLEFLKELNQRDVAEELKVVYIKTNNPFSELEEFVHETEKHYCIKLLITEGNLKLALANILTQDNKLKVCLMGTRRTDPHSKDLNFTQKTDPGWPDILRVSPLLNWSYKQIWSYILKKKVPYCSLYNKGYTSIGSTINTQPNPSLMYRDTTGNILYHPAWRLTDGAEERAGRLANGNKPTACIEASSLCTDNSKNLSVL